MKDPIWEQLYKEAESAAQREPALVNLLDEVILSRSSLTEALSIRLSRKLAYQSTPEGYLKDTFLEVFKAAPNITLDINKDIVAINERDPACCDYLTPILFYKGFHALTCARISHYLWNQGRKEMACYLQSLVSEVFAVDIHPAATFGHGIMLDHATGFVAGETAVIDDNVSILHEVTLGGTGKQTGDRHPKIRCGVLIGAGAKLLGNIVVGKGARVGAGSVVLEDVPEHATVVGVPAKIVGRTVEEQPAFGMNHNFSYEI